MEISKKWLYVYMAVFAVALCFAWRVNADVVVQQSVADTTQQGSHDTTYWGANAEGIVQTLGTSTIGNLTGTLYQIAFWANVASSTEGMSAQLIDCGTRNPDNGDCRYEGVNYDFLYNLRGPNGESSPVFGSGFQYVSFFATTSSIVFNSTHRYILVAFMTRNIANNTVQFKGSAGNTYTGGSCRNGWYNAAAATACSSTSDLAFTIINSETSESVNNSVTTVSPANQSTTATTNVLFQFQYTVSSAYTRAGIVLKDLTTGQSINTQNSSTTINATGSYNYAAYKVLTSGHLYQWQPYIYTTDNSLPAIYGTTQTFFVVTTSNYQSLYIQQATSTNPFATSTIYTCWTTNNCFAQSATSSFQYSTSSVTARCAIRSLPDVVATQMAIKMPFSYICDIALLMTELAYGNGTYAGNIVAALPNSFHGSTTNVTMLDQTAIAGLGELGSIKQLMKYTVYFMTALAIIGMALGAL